MAIEETIALVQRQIDSDSVRTFTRNNAIVMASTSSAVVSVIAGYPFDLIKTRMQAFRYPSTMACMKEIYSMDGGFVGFFRGVGPILLTVSVFRSISFSVYTTVKPLLMDQFTPESVNKNLQSLSAKLNIAHLSPDNLKLPTLPSLSLPSIDLSPLVAHMKPYLSERAQYRLENMQTPSTQNVMASIIAGSCAGTIVATLNAPIEFVKIQRQLDTKMRHSPVVTSTTLETMVESSAGAVASGTAGGLGEGAAVTSISKIKEKKGVATPYVHKHKTAWDWTKKIVREKGVLGLYSGYYYHLQRDFIGTGMYFGGYESMKVLFTPKGETPGPMVHMMAGGLSGTLSWIVLYPIDLIKSVMQKEAMQPIPKYTSAKQFISRRYKKSGIAGFYPGIGAQLTRSFPVHALNFLVYEAVLKWCHR
ncbi:mitochondrial carrier [Rhizoclosmatium globosum]|uniref:Mitochondrial carrier n=1 Tax=Rhizoclosmatium globosum TaxID=329046 RepID=A0A1Y2BNQ9_9FUNG|nr:mitochondrial carrier [Rhizoclosmatium globosum]|eukprot:ORY36386.1 mitochondrial carrier [Rhizoclosmatium globosum]